MNKKGEIKWTDSGIRGILKNEKYKGDLLMGKTYEIFENLLMNAGHELKTDICMLILTMKVKFKV